MWRHLFGFVLGVGFAVGVRAQAPDSVAGMVISYGGEYATVGMREIWTVVGLLRTDGVFVALWESRVDNGVDFGPQAGHPTHWTYTKTSETTGTLHLSADGEPPLQPGEFRGGPDEGPYDLTFTTPSSGTDRQPSPALTFSTPFTLRASQQGQGPANLSTLLTLAAGGSATSGFVLNQPQSVLVRAVGSSLATFGVPNPSPDATVTIYQGQKPVGTTIAWAQPAATSQAFAALFAAAGAFPLATTGGDQALFLDLPAGAYSAVLSTKSGGAAMLEVYFLP